MVNRHGRQTRPPGVPKRLNVAGRNADHRQIPQPWVGDTGLVLRMRAYYTPSLEGGHVMHLMGHLLGVPNVGGVNAG